MKKLIFISILCSSVLYTSISKAEIIDMKTAAIVKSLDGDKVKVTIGKKNYVIPKKDVIGDSSHLMQGEAVMVSLKSMNIKVITDK